MSNDDDYGDLRGSDAWQVAMLGPRRGDNRIARHDANARWGSTQRLDPIGSTIKNAQQSATLIVTPDFDHNLPIAYQLRFALSAVGPFLPTFPVAADSGAVIELLTSVDMKAGAANESVTLFPGQRQPNCQVICRKLTVTMRNLSQVGFDPGDNITLYIRAAACPVTNVDCDDLLGKVPVNGYSIISAQEFIQTQLATPIVALAPNAKRAQFFVQNTSTNSDVIIQWGADAGFGPPAKGVMILPAGINGIYESPIGSWTGEVTISFSNGTGDGGALITEGSF